MIPIIRGFFLVGAVLSVLQGTVLFEVVERRIVAPIFAFYDRQGAPLPALLRDRRVRRAWPILMALVLGALWWFTGTPAGARLLAPRLAPVVAP